MSSHGNIIWTLLGESIVDFEELAHKYDSLVKLERKRYLDYVELTNHSIT